MRVQTASSDKELISQARKGNNDAFSDLVTRHRSALYANCLGILRDPLLVEDAAQEAILRAILGIDGLREPEAFGSWLIGIALNVSRGMLRQTSRDDWSWRAIQGGHLDGFVSDASDPQVTAEATETALGVRAAVASLPAGQREAVVRFYFTGLTVAETAEKLGINKGAVKTRLHKARATLRRRLENVRKEDGMPATRNMDAVEVRVAAVRRAPADAGGPKYHMLVLEEVGGGRRLPIWVGEYEGTAIALKKEGVEGPRPLTFSFMAAVLKAAGARLREVRIHKLVEGTFYAVAELDVRDRGHDVDCRPSDAISLALSTGVPIRVDLGVFAASDEHLATHDHDLLPADKYNAEGSVGAAEIAAEVVSRWPGFEPPKP